MPAPPGQTATEQPEAYLSDQAGRPAKKPYSGFASITSG